jgi:hypothetical protein
MDMECTNGRMEASIKVIGFKIKSQAMVNIHGMIKELIKGIGLIIICMAKEYTDGRMEDNTKVIT